MNLRVVVKRCVVEAMQSIATFMFAAILFAAFSAGTNRVQSIEFGVLALAFGLALITSVEFTLIEKYVWAQPWWFSGSWLQKHWSLAVTGLFLLPLAISSLMNESITAAYDPLGYWRSELKMARNSHCSTAVLEEAQEELRVVQNKYRMGIATTSDLNIAILVLQSVTSFYEKCQSKEIERLSRATKRLAELERK